MLKTATRPCLEAHPGAPAIDRAHLVRMTLGDASLERELLILFDRQAELLLARMRDGTAGKAAALAHTLKGSASGVGAWQVAQAAADCERAVDGKHLDALAAAIAVVRGEIASMLGTAA